MGTLSIGGAEGSASKPGGGFERVRPSGTAKVELEAPALPWTSAREPDEAGELLAEHGRLRRLIAAALASVGTDADAEALAPALFAARRSHERAEAEMFPGAAPAGSLLQASHWDSRAAEAERNLRFGSSRGGARAGLALWADCVFRHMDAEEEAWFASLPEG